MKQTCWEGEGRAETTAVNATVPQTTASGRHPPTYKTHPRFSELLLGNCL